MGRIPRQISRDGLYHIYFCGINKQSIFIDDADREYFLDVLKRAKSQHSFLLFASCQLKNCVNLFIKETQPGTMPVIIQKILTGYASYFNRKYKRSGSLFENRYRSDAISSDEANALINFIHKQTTNFRSYRWNSYTGLVTNNPLFDRFDDSSLDEIHRMPAEKGFDLSDFPAVKRRKLSARLSMLLEDIPAEKIKELPKVQRDQLLSMLRKNGFTIGQLMELTGISRSIITRCAQTVKKPENSRDMQVFLL